MSKKDTNLCLRFKLCGDLGGQWENQSVLLIACKKDKEVWRVASAHTVKSGSVDWNDETFTYRKKASVLGVYNRDNTEPSPGGSKKKLNLTFKLVLLSKPKDEIAKWIIDVLTFVGSIDGQNREVKKAHGSPRLVV
jgi:hypothetical protein